MATSNIAFAKENQYGFIGVVKVVNKHMWEVCKIYKSSIMERYIRTQKVFTILIE
jgi:hypothetical protein